MKGSRFSTSWCLHFMQMAHLTAMRSKDPVRKVGCVLVSPDRREVAFGYNGFPMGIEDHPARLADPTLKASFMVHAELNAILNARRPVVGWSAFVTQHPCHECAKALIQAGVVEVHSPPPKGEASKWHASHRMAVYLLEQVGTTCLRYALDEVAMNRVLDAVYLPEPQGPGADQARPKRVPVSDYVAPGGQR